MPSSSSTRAWSGRPPAMSANGGRTARTASSCSARSSAGTNPRMPTPQGRAPTSSRVRRSSSSDLRSAQQGERQERQGAGVGDGRRELGPVADPRHRALDDRVLGAVRGREPGVASERVARAGRGEMLAHRLADRRDDPSDGHEPPGQLRGEGAVLSDREHPAGAVVPGDAPTDVRAPRALGLERIGLAFERGRAALELARALQVGPGEQAERGAEGAAEAGRLAAVHRGDALAHRQRQRRLAREQDLAVEHDPRGARDRAGGGRVQPHAAMSPDRNPQRAGAALQQDEGALLADPTRGLVPGGDDGVGARVLGGLGVLAPERLHDRQRSGGVDLADQVAERRAASGDHHGLQARRRQLPDGVGQAGGGVHGDGPAPARGAGEAPQGRGRLSLVAREAEVERADRAGATRRDGEARLGRTGRSRARGGRAHALPGSARLRSAGSRRAWSEPASGGDDCHRSGPPV